MIGLLLAISVGLNVVLLLHFRKTKKDAKEICEQVKSIKNDLKMKYQSDSSPFERMSLEEAERIKNEFVKTYTKLI